MNTSIYNRPALFFELSKAVCALLAVLYPLLFLNIGMILASILILLTIIFLIYLFKILAYFKTYISWSNESLKISYWKTKKIYWSDLKIVKLHYYSTKKTGENGWYNLQLGGTNITIKINSHLNDFEALLHYVIIVAEHNNISIDPITNSNLKSFGIKISK